MLLGIESLYVSIVEFRMSVRDRIKLFEKSESLTKPSASISPPVKRTSGISPSVRKTMTELESHHFSPNMSQTPSPLPSRRIDAVTILPEQPVAHEAYPMGSPAPPLQERQSASPNMDLNNIQSPPSAEISSPKSLVDSLLVPDEHIEQVYYEMDNHLIESLQRINTHTTINHSLILNKPLFPKPCMYTG